MPIVRLALPAGKAVAKATGSVMAVRKPAALAAPELTATPADCGTTATRSPPTGTPSNLKLTPPY
ncbi:hypothetical protein D9M69_723040 [compost metagenome]